MSIREETINGVKYKIGTMSREGRGINIETGKENDISTFNLLVPTYGAWAGPEWAANVRAPRGSNINWDYLPCYNESIKNYTDPEAIDPVTGKQYKEKCYSGVDAITKHHDWDYEKAEHDTSNEASLKMAADIEMLNSVALAQQNNGAYTYPCVSGTGIGYKPATETTKEYTSNSLDSTENKYAGLLTTVFSLKLVGDALCVTKEAVVNTFKSIWGYVTGALGTDKISFSEGNQTLTAQGTATTGVTLSTYVFGEKSSEKAWVLDTNTCKEYYAGNITFGSASVKAESTFEYLGDGKIAINGGTGGDRITTGKNESDEAQFDVKGGDGNDTIIGGNGDDTLDGEEGNDRIVSGSGDDILIGGGGEDKYILTYGSGDDEINDSGENEIYYTDENGDYHEAGNFYKESTDAFWSSLDDETQFNNSSKTIVLEDGGTIELSSDFEEGDFGIRLIDVPDNPTITNTITGDQNPPNFNDELYDTAANDRIEGLTGDDYIKSTLGGNDWLLGGAGSDVVVSQNATGKDILEGNAGSDILWGGLDDDKVFGENYGEMDTLIAEGETAQSINERGDCASGCAGNDFIYGSNRTDLLFGSDGHDLIVGVGGDDVIWGDNQLTYAVRNWGLTIESDA